MTEPWKKYTDDQVRMHVDVAPSEITAYTYMREGQPDATINKEAERFYAFALDVIPRFMLRASAAEGERDQARADFKEEQSEHRLLSAEVNTAHVAEFFHAVKNEAAHQRLRWGAEHDAGKRVEDWSALFTYLLGKLVSSHWEVNREKVLHHVVTVAAVAANMHANLVGTYARLCTGTSDEAITP